MKSTVLAILLSLSAVLTLVADTPAISIVEQSSKGESRNAASVRAVDEATRREILKLWQDAKKVFPKNRRNLYGPDSGFVTLTLTNGHEEIVVRSWHPLFEGNPKVVVTSHGVEALGGRNRDDVLKNDEAWYREARRVFDEGVSYTKTKADGGEQPASCPK